MKPFEVVCITCNNNANKGQKPYEGLVNHNYIPQATGLVIHYKCFTCDTEFELPVSWTNPDQHTPKSKEDFKKKLGIKEKIIH